jgi:hypothetical protein
MAAIAGDAAAAGAGSDPACAGACSAAGGAAGVGHPAAGGMAQQGTHRGPLATFDSMLTAYLAYLALPDDAARAAFLRDRAGFTHPG